MEKTLIESFPVGSTPVQRHSRSAGPVRPPADSKEIGRLRTELDRAHRELADAKNALLTSNEHGDFLQDHLYHLSSSLAAEIRERQASEEKLQRLLSAITREKGDLEVLIQILIDQGDTLAEDGEKARIDSLTRIPNRRRLDEYLVKQWRRHAKLQEPLSLLLCDVDHFKMFNDHYGHQAGDECLRTVARRFRQCLREDDLVARYGGEEFAIVLPHTPRDRAAQMAERVLDSLAGAAVPHATSPVLDRVTISIGVACRIPEPRSREAHELLREADQNLYLAKQRGRNCAVSRQKEQTKTW